MNQKYLFPSNQTEHDRLLRLNEVYNPYTFQYLNKLIQPGMNVLEYGPGIGMIGKWLVSSFPDIGYTALDISEEQLNAVKTNFIDAKLNPPKTIRGSIANVNMLLNSETSYDIIYGRWVLAYLPNKDDVISTVSQLTSFLKPGGYLVIEEGDVTPCQAISLKNDGTSHNNITAFNNWYELTMKLQTPCKIDMSLGSTIANKLANSHKLHQAPYAYQPHLTTEYEKAILALAIPGSRKRLIELGLTTISESKQLETNLWNLAQDDSIHIEFIKNTIVTIQKELAHGS